VTLALIDGDLVCYRASVVQEDTLRWDRNTVTTTMTGSAHAAAEMALELVKTWAKLAGCKRALVCFTGENNFRKRLLPSYKANRKGGKPLCYQETVAAVADRFRTERLHGLEADDLLGILATTLPKYSDAIVVSLDKDLRTIPGRHLNPGKETEPVTVMESEANHSWFMQTLMGDTSDGYTGIPGVGVKKAEKILAGTRTELGMWGAVVTAFRAAKLTETDALTQARVARILRRSDYDKDSKSVLLWHPTAPIPMLLEERHDYGL
jgi:5'-3' exonuclease